jgi:HD-GYP domain-containing protein (c-di-GMP phosphodiesterase class II)
MNSKENHELLWEHIDQLNTIGIALSAEQHTARLLEMILLGAKRITQADGGSIYSVSKANKEVQLEIMRTDSLNFAMGGTTGTLIPQKPISLFLVDGQPNDRFVVTTSVLQKKTIVIPDAYASEEFDFSGTREFDKKNNYRSQSFLTIPMKNHEDDVIGVLQLINARDQRTGKVIAFTPSERHLAESLASQAAIALANRRLIDEQKKLFNSFIKLMAAAIDEKSPYTGSHCKRVPLLTKMLAEAADRAQTGVFKAFRLTEESRYELEVASWLHDCGKITTPDHIMDKATKLETIVDRINTICERIEILKRDAKIALQTQQIKALQQDDSISINNHETHYRERIDQLTEDQAFLRKHNSGGEFMHPEDQVRVRQIGSYSWTNELGIEQPLLSKDEMENLCIPKGTLTESERRVVTNHVSATIKMLDSLPFPKALINVPKYAGSHHECPDGSGYPNKLTGDAFPIPGRILAIADIFEALTNTSRPYKKGMPVSQALKILEAMKNDGKIDSDILDLFVREKIYLKYAESFLDEVQIDVT